MKSNNNICSLDYFIPILWFFNNFLGVDL
jgi:hypothetical protein